MSHRRGNDRAPLVVARSLSFVGQLALRRQPAGASSQPETTQTEQREPGSSSARWASHATAAARIIARRFRGGRGVRRGACGSTKGGQGGSPRAHRDRTACRWRAPIRGRDGAAVRRSSTRRSGHAARWCATQTGAPAAGQDPSASEDTTGGRRTAGSRRTTSSHGTAATDKGSTLAERAAQAERAAFPWCATVLPKRTTCPTGILAAASAARASRLRACGTTLAGSAGSAGSARSTRPRIGIDGGRRLWLGTAFAELHRLGERRVRPRTGERYPQARAILEVLEHDGGAIDGREQEHLA